MGSETSPRGSRFDVPIPFSRYLESIAEGFCPYLIPAQECGVLTFSYSSFHHLQDVGQGCPERGLLAIGVIRTELLRTRRTILLSEGAARAASLICDNIVIEGSEVFPAESAKKLLDWPHYILKSLYSEVGLMFGKFWTDEHSDSLSGKPVPPPPITFISIRNANPYRDPTLLKEQTLFAEMIKDSVDDGRDVLAPLLSAQIYRGPLTPEAIIASRIFETMKQKLSKTQ